MALSFQLAKMGKKSRQGRGAILALLRVACAAVGGGLTAIPDPPTHFSNLKAQRPTVRKEKHMSDNPMEFFKSKTSAQVSDTSPASGGLEVSLPTPTPTIGHSEIAKPVRYFDETLVTLTKGNPEETFFLSGYTHHPAGYKFSGKIFDIGSPFGIIDGRISKLYVKSPQGKTAAHYERGWSEIPTSRQDMEALETILVAFRSFEELSKPTP